MSPVSGNPLIAGRYRLDDQVAADGFGEVWQGTDIELARSVAIKLLGADAADAEAVSKFRTAACRGASLTHEGLVRVFDYCEPEQSDSERRPFLVMEYVDGQSLAGHLHARPLAAAEVADVIAQVAAALRAVHRAGLAHGDIKPEKILLSHDGAAKLFGFSGTSPAGSAAIGADLHALGLVARACLAEGGSGGPSEQPPAALAALITDLCASQSADQPDATAVLADRARALCAQLAQAAAATQGAARAATLTGNGAPRAASPAAQAAALSATPAAQAAALATTPAAQAAAPAATSPVQPAALAAISSTSAPAPAAASLLSTSLPSTPRPSTLTLARLPSSGRRPAAALGGQRPAHPRGNAATKRGTVVAVRTSAIIAIAIAAVTIFGALKPGATAQQANGTDKAAPVRVTAAQLIGRPVTVVRLQLERLGLIARVQWRESQSVGAGDVITVSPAGLVPAHSVVVIVGSTGGPPAAGAAPPAGRSRSPAPSPSPSTSPTPPPGPVISPAPSDSPPAPSSPPPPSDPPPSPGTTGSPPAA